MKRRGETVPAKTVRENGRIEWRDKEGKFHREDGPALDVPHEGARAWYIHGKLHREDGPAAQVIGRPCDAIRAVYRVDI